MDASTHFEQLFFVTQQESLRLAALLARSLITKQEKRCLRMRFFCFAALAKIVARKVVKALIACFLKDTCKGNEMMKLLQKKSSSVYPNLFSANSEKCCC